MGSFETRSSSPSASEAVPQDPTEHATRARTRNYAYPFVIALVAGVAVISMVPHFLPPLIVMTVYMLYGLATARREGLVIEFSDSIYYLGFALTLLALVHALDIFAGETKQGDINLLGKFGVALLTTIYGVVVRVGMQLYYKTTQEQVESTTRQMEEVSRQFLATTEELHGRLAGVLRSVIPQIETDVRESLETTKTSLRSMSASLKRSSVGAEKHATALAEAAEGMQRLANAANASQETFEMHVKNMAESLSQAALNLEASAAAVGEQISSLRSEAIEPLAEGFRSLLTSANTLASVAQNESRRLVTDGLEPLRVSLNGVGSSATDLVRSLRGQVADLGSDGLPTLRRALDSISGSARQLVATLEAQNANLRSGGLQPLETSLQDLKSSIQGVDRLVEETLEVIRKRIRTS